MYPAKTRLYKNAFQSGDFWKRRFAVLASAMDKNQKFLKTYSVRHGVGYQ